MVRTTVELDNFIITCILNDCETSKNIKTFVLVYENIILFTKITIYILNY